MAPPAGRVGMMQIDCEVMNTQLIHVQKSAMPKRENENKNQSNFGQGDYWLISRKAAHLYPWVASQG